MGIQSLYVGLWEHATVFWPLFAGYLLGSRALLQLWITIHSGPTYLFGDGRKASWSDQRRILLWITLGILAIGLFGIPFFFNKPLIAGMDGLLSLLLLMNCFLGMELVIGGTMGLYVPFIRKKSEGGICIRVAGVETFPSSRFKLFSTGMPRVLASLTLAVAIAVGACYFHNSFCIGLLVFNFVFTCGYTILWKHYGVRKSVKEAARFLIGFPVVIMIIAAVVIFLRKLVPNKEVVKPTPSLEESLDEMEYFDHLEFMFGWLYAAIFGIGPFTFAALTLRLDYARHPSQSTEYMPLSTAETDLPAQESFHHDEKVLVDGEAYAPMEKERKPQADVRQLKGVPSFAKPYHTVAMSAFLIGAILVHVALAFSPRINIFREDVEAISPHDVVRKSRLIYICLFVPTSYFLMICSVFIRAWRAGELRFVWRYAEQWTAEATMQQEPRGDDVDEEGNRGDNSIFLPNTSLHQDEGELRSLCDNLLSRLTALAKSPVVDGEMSPTTVRNRCGSLLACHRVKVHHGDASMSQDVLLYLFEGAMLFVQETQLQGRSSSSSEMCLVNAGCLVSDRIHAVATTPCAPGSPCQSYIEYRKKEKRISIWRPNDPAHSSSSADDLLNITIIFPSPEMLKKDMQLILTSVEKTLIISNIWQRLVYSKPGNVVPWESKPLTFQAHKLLTVRSGGRFKACYAFLFPESVSFFKLCEPRHAGTSSDIISTVKNAAGKVNLSGRFFRPLFGDGVDVDGDARIGGVPPGYAPLQLMGRLSLSHVQSVTGGKVSSMEIVASACYSVVITMKRLPSVKDIPAPAELFFDSEEEGRMWEKKLQELVASYGQPSE